MKKTLFAVALLASSSAFAMDVSNPFYVPMKGDFLSETAFTYDNSDHGKEESALLSETVSYGITQNFSVNGTLADRWLFDTKGVTGHDRYDNPAWGLGLKWNVVDCCKTNWKVQLGANYDQGGSGYDHHEKVVSAFAKAGYQIKAFLPYVTLKGYHHVGEDDQEDTAFDVRMALNTAFSKKVNLDLGGTYFWNSDADDNKKHPSQWELDATLNYVFSDCMSAGLKGTYVLDAKPDNYDNYTIGVNFKVAF